MPYTGNKPSAVPLTSADIADSIITSAKIVDGTIANADINSSAAITYSKLSLGTSIVNADISASAAITLNKLSGNPSFRNRIINGDMSIDQRNAGASVTPSSGAFTYTLDRWSGYASQSSKYTVQQNAGSVTKPAGFTNYLGVTSSSAYSVISSDLFVITQPIEGLNVADLGFGTANAKTVTVSFWVRSSLTGTFGGSLLNSAGNRSYPFTYTINSANTFEFKTITINGDTSGTWLTTNGIGIYLSFGIGVGSTYSGTASAWAGSQFWSATGATSVIATSGATLYITGVQLEAGTGATDFEFLPYDVSLAKCQRYGLIVLNGAGSFGLGCSVTTTQFLPIIGHPVTMRTTPTLTYSSGSYYAVNQTGGNTIFTTIALNQQNTRETMFTCTGATFTRAGDAGVAFAYTSSAYIFLSAEL
jgi:hypothetical protein